jgi:hypothetical protein
MKRTTSLLLAGLLLSGAVSLLTLPGRLLGRALETDTVLTSYERFVDLNANFSARLAQLRDLQAQGVATAEDRTDLNGVRQSCREIAAAYNADAGKLNRQPFRDRRLPPALDAGACERGAR